MTIRAVSDGVEIAVRVQPRASRSEIVGVHDNALKVRVKAPPVEGAANDELTKLLAKKLKVPRSSVEVVRGHTARSKRIRVTGIGLEEAEERLPL